MSYVAVGETSFGTLSSGVATTSSPVLTSRVMTPGPAGLPVLSSRVVTTSPPVLSSKVIPRSGPWAPPVLSSRVMTQVPQTSSIYETILESGIAKKPQAARPPWAPPILSSKVMTQAPEPEPPPILSSKVMTPVKSRMKWYLLGGAAGIAAFMWYRSQEK